LVGAGISTAAGIPDFRSPETGLYSNLAKFNLPYPEAVFDISYFRQNPAPFYALAQELEPGQFRPTLTHSFIRLLADKGLLHMCFTQNIDTLERRAGVPESKLVEAHGSFATHACISCRQKFPDADMKIAVATQEIPHCKRCKGLVKPNITFFGEELPVEFHKKLGHVAEGDLVIIMGTSLTVHPFAQLPSLARRDMPRLLINLQRVGDVGSRVNDVVKLGDCDTIVKELCEELGWIEELNRLWDATADTVDKNEAKGKAERDEEALAKKADDQDAQDAVVTAQVEAISRAVQERLRIVDEHTAHALAEIARDIEDEPREEYEEEYDDYYLESDSDGEPALASISSAPTNKNAGISSKGQEAKPFGTKLAQSANPLNPQNVQAPSVDETGKDENNAAKTNI